MVCISEIVHYGRHPSRAYACRGYSFSKFFLDFFYPITFIKFGYYPNEHYLCSVILNKKRYGYKKFVKAQ